MPAIIAVNKDVNSANALVMSVQKCNESQVEVFDVWVQLHALSVSW